MSLENIQDIGNIILVMSEVTEPKKLTPLTKSAMAFDVIAAGTLVKAYDDNGGDRQEAVLDKLASAPEGAGNRETLCRILGAGRAAQAAFVEQFQAEQAQTS